MIKNRKQLTLTNKRIDEFHDAISTIKQEKSDLHPILQKAQIDALVYQRNELSAQALEYEQLLSGEFVVFDVESISDLPKALIRARISIGLTQKDLAERLGMKEQQIQRYENTEYSSVSFAKLVSIVEALDLKITEDVFLPKESRTKNLLLEKLKDTGLDKTLIEKRIAPRDISPLDFTTWVDKTVGRLSEIFGWSKDLLLGDAPLAIGRDASMVARFKMPAGANEQYATAYTQYAYCLANLVSKNFQGEIGEVSNVASITKENILNEYGEVDFKSILSYVTSLGIPIITLNDTGAFHGATWRINGRNIIVLKQKSLHLSKWAFDLLHELYHASQNPELKEFSVIELSETCDERRLDQEEVDANEFAAKVLLGENSQEYVEQCFKGAKGRIAWLKNSVIQVAEREKLDCGVLAYQVANKVDQMSRSTGKKKSWWGAAHNLQVNPYNPKIICIEMLKENLSLETLEPFERELIEQALIL
ncbi:MAG: helix-turn-helix domain-containing protein [Colwellia sp.]|nr:helix-turn-helix domain-containing protein [Colwellia sp.]